KNPSDVWKLSRANFEGAHFAVFPEKLIEPFVKSSCPERICSKCGKASKKQFVKVVDKSGSNRGEYSKHQKSILKPPNDWKPSLFKESGWTDCGCAAGWEKGIVLDPFLGSGTTAVTALKQNKNFVGIELNPEYIELAKKRIKPFLEQTRLTDFQEVI
ncbi:MAG: site-specific DNA-methyltransferase, partial [Candidatus Heimdallarchaeota archaeon]|nr:site-specific DNA-methyltransferase [Candidatus Heimdallarchaeota archaeon]